MIANRKEVDAIDKDKEEKFNSEINKFVKKLMNSISSFRFNVAIANFYEMYNYAKDFVNLNVSNKVLKDNIIKLMTLLIPFTPHLANECLELLNIKNTSDWPNTMKKNF